MEATPLIKPTAAAAAERLSKVVGIAQNVERNALQNAIMLKSVTSSTSELPVCAMSPSAPSAATNIGTAECQRRSMVLSECQPLAIMATNISKYGIMPTMPTPRFESVEARLSMVGNQK